MNVIASWTGARADALRQAMRMTNESFAGHLGVAARTVAYWRERPWVVPRPAVQEILDAALAQASASARDQFTLLVTEREVGGTASMPVARGDDDLGGLADWMTATNASDQVIEAIDHARDGLAGRHAQTPARRLLTDVRQVHSQVAHLLRSGHQRLRQTRELMRIDGYALAHASILLGDIGRGQQAQRYGQTAALLLNEAEASPDVAMYALAKTARWQDDYSAAADLAVRGIETRPATPMSVQLAYYEANAAALLGDRYRARQALTRADQIAQALTDTGTVGSPWSFPAERQAIFRMSVLLRAGDPEGALAAAEAADRGWRNGDPYIPGTWAQIRIGAAIARLQQDTLDGAAEEASAVLTLPPEFRISTVTGWLDDLDGYLARPRFAASPAAISLRLEISNFHAGALPTPAKGAG